MIASGLKGIGKALEYRFPVMPNERGFSVHDPCRNDDAAAKSVSYALMAEAYAQQRHLAGESLYDFIRDARFPGGARPRRDEDLFGPQFPDFPDRDLVVAVNDKIRAQFSQVLDQIVRERVVIIDDEYHGRWTLRVRWPGIAPLLY